MAIPTGVQIFCFIATLAAGRVVRSVPMLYAFGSLVIFVLGGLTGVMVAVAPFDFQAHDTFFVVAHFHYVLIGGALFPILAGCYYFFPLINGKMLSDKLGKIAFWLAFIGFNIAFLPMHMTGLRGMPRRVFTYPAGLGFDALNLTSTIGAFILAAGLAVVFWDIVRPKKKQPYAARNPWQAGTIEWAQEMPGKPWGIRSIPEIDSRYPLWDQPNFVRDIDRGPLLFAGCRRREAGNDHHFGHRCAAAAMRAASRFIIHHSLGRSDDRRLFHLRHLSLVVAGAAQPGAGARRHHLLVMDRDGAHS